MARPERAAAVPTCIGPSSIARRTMLRCAKSSAKAFSREMPGAWQLSPHEVASVAAYVETVGRVPVEPLPGDRTRGERVYLAKGCSGCHMIHGQGAGFGPELTDIGARRSPAHLRQTILTPESTIPEGFMLVEAVINGATVRGVRVNEDTFSIQIKDAKAEFHSYRKADLKELRKLKGKSPMPSYASGMTPDELTDLIAYLASLRGRS